MENRTKLNLVKSNTAGGWKAAIDASVEKQLAALSAKGEANPVEAPAAVPAKDHWTLEAIGTRGRKELRTALRTMDDHEAAQLWAVWKALGPNHNDCFTPVEHLISELATSYMYSLCRPDRGVTPENVEDMLKAFRLDFKDMLSSVRAFGPMYAAQIIGAPDKKGGKG